MNWVDIKGYEGLYQVSDTGLVRSLDRWVLKGNNNGTNGLVFIKGQPMKSRLIAGYPCVNLRKEHLRKTAKIHRLVAFHFCNGYFTGAVVNHKDCNKENNSFENLEWVTVAQNTQHAVDNNLIERRFGEFGRSSKWIISTYKGEDLICETCGVRDFNCKLSKFGLNYDSIWKFFSGRVEDYKGYTFTRRLKSE